MKGGIEKTLDRLLSPFSLALHPPWGASASCATDLHFSSLQAVFNHSFNPDHMLSSTILAVFGFMRLQATQRAGSHQNHKITPLQCIHIISNLKPQTLLWQATHSWRPWCESSHPVNALALLFGKQRCDAWSNPSMLGWMWVGCRHGIIWIWQRGVETGNEACIDVNWL